MYVCMWKKFTMYDISQSDKEKSYDTKRHLHWTNDEIFSKLGARLIFSSEKHEFFLGRDVRGKADACEVFTLAKSRRHESDMGIGQGRHISHTHTSQGLFFHLQGKGGPARGDPVTLRAVIYRRDTWHGSPWFQKGSSLSTPVL